MSRNTSLNTRGFTIVELLIVIVVIAILAAISIVAYSGIQNRAKTTSGQSLAGQTAKKLEALNTIKGSYYSSSTGVTGALINTYADASPVAPEAKIDNTASIIAASSASASNLTSSTSSNGTVVSVFACANGANIWYYDFSAGAVATVVKAGAGC